MKSPLLPGLSTLEGSVDALILDIYGVLHDGLKPYSRTVATLKALQNAGINTCLLSNTPLLREGTIAKLDRMGIPRKLYGQIVTGGDSARLALSAWEGHKVWLTDIAVNPATGQLAYQDLWDGLDIHIVADAKEAEVILNPVSGLTANEESLIYAGMEIGLERNLPMICANPDLVVMIGDRVSTCAGTYADWYEKHGGKVTWHGKPHAEVYNEAWDLLGKPDKSRMAGVGDSLRTDVTGANRFGIASVWNLDGIHREEVLDLSRTDIDLARLNGALSKAAEKPVYVLDGFHW
jgi:HAD superfamily hydrolase (TIGR01459 family)